MFKIVTETSKELKPTQLNNLFNDGGDCLKRLYSTAQAAQDAFDHEYMGNTIVKCRVVPATE